MSQDIEYEFASQEAMRSDDKPISLAALGPKLLIEFGKAENDRRQTEERWLQDLRQYRSQYDPEVLALIGPKRSRAFVGKTRVKVKTADSRVWDLLFPAGSEKNWDVDSTPIPSVAPEVLDQIVADLGRTLQGQPIDKVMVDKAVLRFCKGAAKKMAKTIDDQLSEVRYKAVAKQVAHSGHLYGTGILKGPLVEKRIRSRFVQENGKWIEKTEEYIVPFVDYVPLWRFYPDMNASEIEGCKYVYERHQMSHEDLSALTGRKSFDGDVIRSYLRSNPHGQLTAKYVDDQLKIIGDRDANQGNSENRYEVLERWGWLSGGELKEAGITVPDDRLHESFFSNIWLLPNGTIIKAVLQPINGVTWPYHFYYFDKDETSIFGNGLSTIMRDDQTMLNAATRLILDNAAITSGPMVEITPSLISNMDEATTIEPWKVLLRNTSSPGTPAIRAIELPSRLRELEQIANRFENNTDEISAIPRFMTGESVSTGAAGTASGMSMLMGASNIMIKDLISSWDEGVTQPFITALYRWNMQFNPDPEIKGDFDVKARGMSSLVAREVRAQQLDNFAAMTSNPMDAPYIKRDKLLRQRAEAHELSDVVRTEEEVTEESRGENIMAQQELEKQRQALALEESSGKVKLLLVQVDRLSAEIGRINAQTLGMRVGATQSALQAAGLAASNPNIVMAGDEILASAGWSDEQ